MIPGFRKENPNVDVKVEGRPYELVQWGEELKKRTSPYDVVSLGSEMTAAYAEPKLILPLDRLGREGSLGDAEGLSTDAEERTLEHVADASLPNLHAARLGIAAPVIVGVRMQQRLHALEIAAAAQRHQQQHGQGHGRPALGRCHAVEPYQQVDC